MNYVHLHMYATYVHLQSGDMKSIVIEFEQTSVKNVKVKLSFSSRLLVY